MSLRIVPLGGLGEIGMNAMVVEFAGRRLLIDCGLLFPRLDKGRGFDCYVPDMRWVMERPKALDGVLLTHGHEDHLGALPVLLRDLKVPVYGGAFTLGLLKHRLEELRVEADLRLIKAGQRFQAGAFEVEPIHVNHSVPDAFGLALRSEAGTVVHTGDFKVDPDPVDGRPTDLDAFRRAGGEGGALCLLSDSTNAERPGTTGSEREVGRTLRQVIAQAPGRVMVTMFASHLLRLQQLVEIAAETGRKLVVHGRGMVDNMRLGQELGALKGASAVVVHVDKLDTLPEKEVLLVTTGSQGEPRSGLWRMCFDAEARVHIRSRDTVVFCSRPIPGNELGIHELVNALWELGATVVTDESWEGEGRIHVSGHASQDEQRAVLEAVRPRTFIPIHGEARQLARHVRTALQSGFAQQVVLARDGDVVEFTEPGSAQVVAQVPFGKVALERRGGAVVPQSSIAMRGLLSEGGVVTAVLMVERASGGLLRSPELTGLALHAQGELLLQRAREVVRDELAQLSAYARRDSDALREAVERGIHRSFKRDGERKPVVQVIAVDV